MKFDREPPRWEEINQMPEMLLFRQTKNWLLKCRRPWYWAHEGTHREPPCPPTWRSSPNITFQHMTTGVGLDSAYRHPSLWEANESNLRHSIIEIGGAVRRVKAANPPEDWRKPKIVVCRVASIPNQEIWGHWYEQSDKLWMTTPISSLLIVRSTMWGIARSAFHTLSRARSLFRQGETRLQGNKSLNFKRWNIFKVLSSRAWEVRNNAQYDLNSSLIIL